LTGRSSPRVFVLDDQPLIADTLAQVLESRGYEAHARYTSADILDLAAEITPDLLIADVSLGPNQITGIDVAVYLARFYPGSRAILISGDPTTHQLHQQACDEGYIFALLCKPVNPEFLLETVGNMFDRKSDGIKLA
jgi:DNA-binding NtrC family response regulator